MTSKELCTVARSFAGAETCYLKGFWLQKLTQAEYDRVLKMYPRNAIYNNTKYIGTNCYPADCICFIKAITSGATLDRRISYAELAKGPLGDCTNSAFMQKLYDEVPTGIVPAGYGIASEKHAALSLGAGVWIDCNYDEAQNGVKIHTGGVPAGFKCGKIPGIVYPESDLRDELRGFTDWLIDKYMESR